MKHWFTPESFHFLASNFSNYKWRLLTLSVGAFTLYLLLESQITQATPAFLIWLSLAILFAILTKQSLVEYFIPFVLFPLSFSLPPEILLLRTVDLNNNVVHETIPSTGRTLCQKEEGEDK